MVEEESDNIEQIQNTFEDEVHEDSYLKITTDSNVGLPDQISDYSSSLVKEDE